MNIVIKINLKASSNSLSKRKEIYCHAVDDTDGVIHQDGEIKQEFMQL